MISIEQRHAKYLESKMEEFSLRYGNINVMNATKKYNHLYTDLSLSLNQFFSLFHFHFNKALKYMNDRIEYGTYTAAESREFLFLIDEVKTIQSNSQSPDLSFRIVPYYKEVIQQCEGFLQHSNGSPIPPDFQRTNLIEVDPIFQRQATISIKRNGSNTLFPTKSIGGGSYANVRKYKDEYYNNLLLQFTNRK